MATFKILSADSIKRLQQLAGQECWGDNEPDFNPMDYSGGNFDDCYWAGYEHGMIGLARQLLKDIGNSK
jgi:hypothetical protein